MRFARGVFGIAGVWGVVVLTPFFFMFESLGREAGAAADLVLGVLFVPAFVATRGEVSKLQR